MKIAGLVGSIVGSKTKIAMEYCFRSIAHQFPEAETVMVDLKELSLDFSDGRDFRDYEGDTAKLINTLLTTDVIIIGTPPFQASIPGALKNVFDLLPQYAFQDKVIGIIATAGSTKHYLMVEQQLKPILSYMKATIVEKYVFIEEQDFFRQEIINDDVLSRIDRLVEDVVWTYRSRKLVQKEREAQYGF